MQMTISDDQKKHFAPHVNNLDLIKNGQIYCFGVPGDRGHEIFLLVLLRKWVMKRLFMNDTGNLLGDKAHPVNLIVLLRRRS